MASRLKARKPGRGRATTARSRRNDPRGGARTSGAARPSSRMNPRAASARFERETGLAIESSVQAMLTQVEEALARMDDGTYGICENCGRPIHPARLRAIPYAKLCIDCKAKEERANGIARP